ncbi:HNH endonuclease [Methanotorris igneus]|uniref:HNH endonuclease n=1 Tax=Methanotorris igneus (strain DSM 5666 / JCM 11834 / Kol 5) TaxID=880724 RepID=F6BD03_METIK|nr:HNH endonuclease [Methanotorris igneus]AEF96364.1 HNH endonuclease [Methanotorris igneus Kol 5]
MGNVKNKGLSSRIRKKILERDEYKCNICGHKYLQIHILKNGNLSILCKQCHYRAHISDKINEYSNFLFTVVQKILESKLVITINSKSENILIYNKDLIKDVVLRKLKYVLSHKITKIIMEEIDKDIETELRVVSEDIKEQLILKNRHNCDKCGYSYLEIHHIDKNSENNNFENLITLCRECHRNIHYDLYQKTGVGNVEKGFNFLFSRIYEYIDSHLNFEDSVIVDVKSSNNESIEIEFDNIENLNQIFGNKNIDDIFNELNKKISNYIQYLIPIN